MCPGAARRAAFVPGRPGAPGWLGTAPIAPLILFSGPASSPTDPTTHPGASRMCPACTRARRVPLEER